MPNQAFTEILTFTRCAWGDWALELIQHYLRRLNEHHEGTRKFIDELKASGDRT